MNPFELLLWGLAGAVSLVLVAAAVAIVIVLIRTAFAAKVTKR